MTQAYSAIKEYLSTTYLIPYQDYFINELYKNGYSKLTIQGYLDSILHFATWLRSKNITLKQINNNVVNRFSKHYCFCIKNRKSRILSRQYVQRVRYFVSFLCKIGIIKIKIPTTKTLPLTLIKFKKSLLDRGLSNSTISTYEYSIKMLLPSLGRNSKKFNPIRIRKVIFDMSKKHSRCVIKKLATALGVYLRFLTVEGKCKPNLDFSIPTIAEWKLSSLPKYITGRELEKVIFSCDINTKQGLRDLAILLLLGRLGLRAGDVSNLKTEDINWSEGTLRVGGKGRKDNVLPLPQEAGEALLAYIENARPLVPIEKMFLCLKAPYRSFPCSSGISNVVSAAISRAGIVHPPSRGASLLRHTAATNMLRNGASLEMVSAILRHRSFDMTGYYAKVDIRSLRKIAQSWMEVLYVK